MLDANPSRWRHAVRACRRFAASIGPVMVLSACGDDGTAPIAPQALAIVSGNGQTGPAGDVTNNDFTVRVVGSDGQPFAGASVNWAVVSGGGSITPTTAVSDASGIASARLTLGVSFGDNTATATVSGVQPASFTATSVSPCDFLRPIAIGDATVGRLSFPDCPLSDNTLIDFFALDLTQQQRVDVTLGSTAFDAFLFFFDETDVIAANDDASGATDSYLPLLLPAGAYTIGANSSVPATGSYDLSVSSSAEDVTNCEYVWIRPGVTTSQQVTSSDCEVGTNWYGDAFPIFMRTGVTLTVTEQSAAFDAWIEIYDGSTGTLVASDDNGGGGTNARVDYTVGSDVILLVLLTSAAAGQGGDYSMTVVSSGPPPSAARVAGALADVRLPATTQVERPVLRLRPGDWADAWRRARRD